MGVAILIITLVGVVIIVFTQARKNREIAHLQRKIDEVPSRAELTQYQRRFIELYTQGKMMDRQTDGWMDRH